MIAALTPTSQKYSEPKATPVAQPDESEAPEVGESQLRVALATAGMLVVVSAVPSLLRDPLAAATWTIPGVIALALAAFPVGHATRALLAFAPALPALAVRAMGCEGHSVAGALVLAALLVLLPTGLLLRSFYPQSNRARAAVAAGLALGAVWALLPSGGAALSVSGGPWAAMHLPALTFFAVALFSLSAFLPGRGSMGASVWAVVAMAWGAVPVLGSRAEQFGPRVLDAFSLVGLGAIASSTLAALVSVYAPPENAAR